ncbi:RHS repeat-associated core domain-containing protein [Loktanella agnita]
MTDHIGTPRELVSEDGKRTAWRAKFGLRGNAEKIDIWRGEAANGGEVTCNIRFQGQWADEESGLHYNRFRYYDAEAGQYLSSDPIRLKGGIRLQGYVTDPNYWIDPRGLAACAYAENPSQLFAQTRQRAGVDLTPAQMREINATRDRIRRGDTSQFDRDGTPYDNSSLVDPNSSILQSGSYTEWTVRAWHGASQSGPMRIVRETNTGRQYFTPDHYRTFIELDPSY